MSVERRERLYTCALLAALTLLAYGRVAELGFIDLDDPLYVSQNPRVLAGLSLDGIRWALTSTEAQNWHPLTWISLMLDASLGGADPRIYHGVSLLLHVASTVLLFLLLERMTGARGRSAFVAGLFGVHPLHVESVAWIAERKDVLSGLFFMLATAAYVRYTARPGRARLLLVALCLALGLMAKPMLVTLPLVLLLLDFWPLGRLRSRSLRELLLEKAPLFALAIASSVVTFLVQRPAMEFLAGIPASTRIANAAVSCVWYVAKTLWPAGLAVFYPFPRGGVPWLAALGAAAVAGALSLAAAARARRMPWLFVGWFWYVVTLIPVLGLVQVGMQARADRYSYLPSIGIFVVVAWGLPEVVGRARRVLPAAAAVVLIAASLATWVQVGRWRSDLALFEHAARVVPANALAHFKVAATLDAAGDLDGAVGRLREALRIDPGYAKAHYNLTGLLARQGKVDEVAALCREQQERWPDAEATLVDLGVLAFLRGDRQEAEARFVEALRRYPESVPARHNLEALRQTGGVSGPTVPPPGSSALP